MSEFRDRLAEALVKEMDLHLDYMQEAADNLIASGAVADPAEVLTNALHPEFGTEWREPDGVIWKAVQSAKAEFQYVKSDLEHARSAGAAYQRLYAEAKAEAESLRTKLRDMEIERNMLRSTLAEVLERAEKAEAKLAAVEALARRWRRVLASISLGPGDGIGAGIQVTLRDCIRDLRAALGGDDAQATPE